MDSISVPADVVSSLASTTLHDVTQSELKKPRLLPAIWDDESKTHGVGHSRSELKKPKLLPAIWDDETKTHGGDATQSELKKPKPKLLPAIWDDESKTRCGGSARCCVQTIVKEVIVNPPAIEIPILEISGPSNPASESENSELQAPAAEYIALREFHSKWEGTNLIQETDTGKKLPKETIEIFVKERSRIERSIKENSYDPFEWLLLAGVYFDLCYSDLQVSAAHKALVLIRHGLDFNEHVLGQTVRVAICKRLSCFAFLPLTEELEIMQLNAYVTLIRGLYDAASYWDGLKEAKKALKLYPENKDIIEIQEMLRHEYMVRAEYLNSSNATSHELKYVRQSGRMNKKQYPWMDEKLFIRTSSNLATFNKEFNSENCEIRRAQFENSQPSFETSDDVGPLGIFATRNIFKDEVLLIDYNTTLVSNIPPSNMTHCEACHASLHSALLKPSEIKLAHCCNAAAYCSSACHDLATNGYHQMLCGKDFKWLYDSAKKGTAGVDNASWRPITLLRLMAVIISDFKSPSPSLRAQRSLNPLKHPLIARLTANFTNGNSNEQEWSYFSHVIAPNRILMQLGVDIFSDSKWSAEVIHTLYWRMVNNACKTSTVVITEDASSTEGLKIEPYAITGISPGYIFFNHGCKPTVNWMAAGSGYGIGFLNSLKLEEDKKRIKAGGNAMLCIATKDLKEGEEARISYVPEGYKEILGWWFEEGCGCGDCGGDEGH